MSVPHSPPSRGNCTIDLSSGEEIGLACHNYSPPKCVNGKFNAAAGCASLVAVSGLAYIVLRNASRHLKLRQNPTMRWWQILRSPIEIYMINLLMGDFLQGIGIAMNILWVNKGYVACTTTCTIQGIILFMSETLVAMSTLALAIHTAFIILYRRGAESIATSLAVVGGIWVYILLFAIIPNSVHPKGEDKFIRPTLFWCWVGPRYTAERIAGAYFWLWFTAVASLVIYILLYLCLRGNIRVDTKRWWKIKLSRRAMDSNSESSGQVNWQVASDTPQVSERITPARKAFSMLLYPLAYIGTILGLSAVRWIDFAMGTQTKGSEYHETIPPAATFTAQIIFALSGVVNVALLVKTRPGLLYLGISPRKSEDESRPSDSGMRTNTVPVIDLGFLSVSSDNISVDQEDDSLRTDSSMGVSSEKEIVSKL
ncbi:hypothetical protein M422DRAFT_68052 [Sphaerobolus stellatus SS14]|uniref:Glucose receptor Git3 N-terminal domain-containing protein n=1 Tax=Sphaerobolus stellatus (strain SS14) TaxID=990650 RepID=A0A0C9V5N5_SPHS4|nr:hypothetical protein M422DRAFT_68052 [Sphaerobolus stellatus SS14]